MENTDKGLTLKFIYSEKATKFYEISSVDLTVTTQDKSTVEISQKFVAFSEYMNFTLFIVLVINLMLKKNGFTSFWFFGKVFSYGQCKLERQLANLMRLKNNFVRPGLLLAGFQTKVQVFKEGQKTLEKP